MFPSLTFVVSFVSFFTTPKAKLTENNDGSSSGDNEKNGDFMQKKDSLFCSVCRVIERLRNNGVCPCERFWMFLVFFSYKQAKSYRKGALVCNFILSLSPFLYVHDNSGFFYDRFCFPDFSYVFLSTKKKRKNNRCVARLMGWGLKAQKSNKK